MKKTFLAICMILVVLIGASAETMSYTEDGMRCYVVPAHGYGYDIQRFTSRNAAFNLLLDDYYQILLELGLDEDKLYSYELDLVENMFEWIELNYNLLDVFTYQYDDIELDEEGGIVEENICWAINLEILENAVDQAILESGHFQKHVESTDAQKTANDRMNEALNKYFGIVVENEDLSDNVEAVKAKWFSDEAYGRNTDEADDMMNEAFNKYFGL